MKIKIGLYLFLSLFSTGIYAQLHIKQVDYHVKPMYGYRSDGTPGRLVILDLKGDNLRGVFYVVIKGKGVDENKIGRAHV